VQPRSNGSALPYIGLGECKEGRLEGILNVSFYIEQASHGGHDHRAMTAHKFLERSMVTMCVVPGEQFSFWNLVQNR
jgi:hypothetical protein